MGLEVIAAAAATSDCLVTAMLVAMDIGGIMNLDSRVKMMAAERRRVAMWPPSLVWRGRLIMRR